MWPKMRPGNHKYTPWSPARVSFYTNSPEMILLIVVALSLVSTTVSGKNVPNFQEEGRMFGRSYTKTEVVTQLVTSLVPSSCIQVAPTLAPCRNMRFLRFPQLGTGTGLPFPVWGMQNNATSINGSSSGKPENRVASTPLSWGEQLGIFAPTVTLTATQTMVSVVVDPSVVVTFSVVSGCKPLDLPAGIDLCKEAKIQPTRLDSGISPTEMPMPNLHPQPNPLQPSLQQFEDNNNLQQQQQPTGRF